MTHEELARRLDRSEETLGGAAFPHRLGEPRDHRDPGVVGNPGVNALVGDDLDIALGRRDEQQHAAPFRRIGEPALP